MQKMHGVLFTQLVLRHLNEYDWPVLTLPDLPAHFYRNGQTCGIVSRTVDPITA